MTSFQEFINKSIIYSDNKVWQEALINFATISSNGKKRLAKDVTDLSNQQLEDGDYIITAFSDYLCDPEGYVENLKLYLD